jgi:hypothetical protein
VREDLDRVIGKIQTAKAFLTAMLNVKAPMPQRVQHFHDDLTNVGSALRGMRPDSLCPYCRGLNKVKDECSGCETLGYITEAQTEGVPPELAEGNVVLYRTKYVPAGDFIVATTEALWPG